MESLKYVELEGRCSSMFLKEGGGYNVWAILDCMDLVAGLLHCVEFLMSYILFLACICAFVCANWILLKGTQKEGLFILLVLHAHTQTHASHQAAFVYVFPVIEGEQDPVVHVAEVVLVLGVQLPVVDPVMRGEVINGDPTTMTLIMTMTSK